MRSFLATAFLCILFYNVDGQSKYTSYKFTLTDLHSRPAASKDTIVINDDEDFETLLDASGLDTNVKYTITYLHGNEKEDVSTILNGTKLNLRDRKSISFEFHFCDRVIIDDRVKTSLVPIKFEYDTIYKTAAGKDSVIKKDGLTEVAPDKVQETIVSLNKGGKSVKEFSSPVERDILQPKAVCKDEKTVTVLFAKPPADKKRESEKTLDLLTERLTNLLSQNESEPIGEIIMRTSEVNVMDGSSVKRKSKIKRVEMTFVNGAIGRRVLRVELEDGSVFFNRSAPINLPKFDKRKADQLVCYDRRAAYKNQFIEIGDVLDYHYFGRFNYPADGTIILTPDKDRDTLTVGSSLNSLLDVSIYTDLLGLIGNKPNGLIQTEVAGNFISNTGNCRNADIIFHNFMRPYVRLSKFDSRFRSLDSSNIKIGNGGKDTVNRTYLNQVSYFQGGLLANVVRFGIGVNQLVYVSAGADINLVNTDSSYKKDVLFFNFYPEINYTITRLRNFGMDCSLRFLWQKVSDGAPFVNKELIHIVRPQVTLYYFPSKDQASKMYVRFNYFNNLDDNKYNFTQFQIGFKTNLKMSK
jgi:hypothetical protein